MILICIRMYVYSMMCNIYIYLLWYIYTNTHAYVHMYMYNTYIKQLCNIHYTVWHNIGLAAHEPSTGVYTTEVSVRPVPRPQKYPQNNGVCFEPVLVVLRDCILRALECRQSSSSCCEQLRTPRLAGSHSAWLGG